MKKRKKTRKNKSGSGTRRSSGTVSKKQRRAYQDACRLAEEGRHDEARRQYGQLRTEVSNTRMKALISNDLAALAAVDGDVNAALNGFGVALDIDKRCQPAKSNLNLLKSQRSTGQRASNMPSGFGPLTVPAEPDEVCKVAILSFLFNWPSRSGGIVHTVELAQFLSRAGYDVQHIFARYAPWGIGCVDGSLPFASKELEFDESSWKTTQIQVRFRNAVKRFDPDYVIITDCWNFKPLLAEALRGYPYFLRQQAMECLCPLNNLRMLTNSDGQVDQCPYHQLAAPEACAQCVRQRGDQSGGLHVVERALSGVGTSEYQQKLCRAFENAEAVLVLNPLIADLIRPYAKSVRVVTWGMDPDRFPWPWPDDACYSPPERVARIFMAGLVSEYIKGFHVLHEACQALWNKQRDFELVATGEPAGRVDEFTRFVGWLSQDELPRHIREADILVMPTIAQEGLGRTTVEAMAVGRPVIASRIGGLPYTVRDGLTGLLCEPGNAADLAQKLEILLDNPELKQQMGIAGRRVFDEEFTWEKVIDKHYRPLFAARRAREPVGERTTESPRT